MPLNRSAALALKSATTRVDVSAATAPNNGDVLTASSSTAAAWAPPSGGGGMSLLADVTAAGGANTLTSGTITAKTYLEVHIYISGFSAGTALALQFNGDTGANYSYEVSRDSATPSGNAAQTTIRLDNSTSITAARYAHAKITNLTAIAKNLQMSEFENPTSTLITHTGWGLWNNTAAQITSIQVQAGGNTINSGSRMLVFGTS